MAGFPRDRNAPGLGRVLELAVATLRLDTHPTVGTEPLEHLTDFHTTRLTALDTSVNPWRSNRRSLHITLTPGISGPPTREISSVR